MFIYNLKDHKGLPLYESLYRHIRDDILEGKIEPDERIPSKRSLAQALGVSVITVEGAYRQLMAEGYIASRARSGYYVQNITPRQGRKTIPAIHASAPAPTFAIADFSSSPRTSDASFARLWTKTVRDALANEPEEALFSSQPAQGSIRLREAIATWLARSRGLDADPNRIIVTAGAPILYSLVALIHPSEESVAIETPGYGRLKSVYETMGRRVCSLPIDKEGIEAQALEDSDASLVHIMPSHQFPTGRVTTISRRYQLLSWASHQGGRFIVEDDYDWEFRLAGKPIPSLASIDTEGKVIYLGTFSKSLSPTLRIAFGVFPPALDESVSTAVGCFSSTIGTIDQIALARLLESGDYERHVNRYRNTARTTRDQLIDALNAGPLAPRLSFEECDSGLHFVLGIDSKASAVDIAREAATRDVGLAPLERYEIGRPLPHDGKARFVMQYERIKPDALARAAHAISEAVFAAEAKR